jgi:hypothetical protein
MELFLASETLPGNQIDPSILEQELHLLPQNGGAVSNFAKLAPGQTVQYIVKQDVQHWIDLFLQHPPCGSTLIAPLQQSILPINQLNVNDEVSQPVYRMCEYYPAQSLAAERIRALRFRNHPLHTREICFDIVADKAFPVPKGDRTFLGLSCSINPTFVPDYVRRLIITEDQFHNDPVYNTKKKRAAAVGVCIPADAVRSFVTYRLVPGVHTPVSSYDWLVDLDGVGYLNYNHVTVAVWNDTGLPGVPVDTNVRVHAMDGLNWVRDNSVLVLEAVAEWRTQDYFPDDPDWVNTTDVLNAILKKGPTDEFVNIWYLHQMIKEDPVGFVERDCFNDVRRPLEFAYKIISAYLYDDEYDVNSPDRAAVKALRYLHGLINKVSICSFC